MSKNSNNAIPDSIKNYKIEKEIYKLSTITFYSAINTDINEKVLIHIFPKEVLKTKANEVTFMNNHVFLMKLLNHKNILKLYEIIETKKYAFLIYEYFEGVKLSEFISKKKKLNNDESMIIFKELLSVLVYLHDMYLCNLNLNSDNILIDTKHNIKLCNFKFGHFYLSKQKSRTNLIGDHFSTCPELLSKKPYNPELADIWSMGVLFFQLVTGQLPFKSTSHKDLDLIRLIIKGNYTIPNSVSSNFKTLIKGMLELKEDKRFKIKDIFNHQLLKDKKITKESLTHGLNILITKYPIDGTVLNICKNTFKIDPALIIKQLQINKYSPYTSLFKQIVTKLAKKGIPTINDLYSSKFKAYLNDSKNYLKEEQQKNNIQNYLQKEEEIKKNSHDMSAILLNNQNEITKGLEDLKKQFERQKNGIKMFKRNRSFGNMKNKKRRTYQLDRNKDIMNSLNKINNMANNVNKNANNPSSVSGNKKNANNVNLIPVKRNTVCMPDLEELNKKGKTGNKKIGEEKQKVVEEIKEENEDKNKELKKSDSENSLENSKSSDSESSSDKEEKKEDIKDEKKENIRQIQTKEEEKKEDKKPEKKEGKKPEKKEENKINIVKQDRKPFIGMPMPKNPVKLNKVPNYVNTEPKSKKMMSIHQNDIHKIDKKPKINVKKEDINKGTNILKNKNDLKNQNKSTIEPGKPTSIKKNEPPKVSGIKNIKEMIEANIRQKKAVKPLGSIKNNK